MHSGRKIWDPSTQRSVKVSNLDMFPAIPHRQPPQVHSSEATPTPSTGGHGHFMRITTATSLPSFSWGKTRPSLTPCFCFSPSVLSRCGITTPTRLRISPRITEASSDSAVTNGFTTNSGSRTSRQKSPCEICGYITPRSGEYGAGGGQKTRGDARIREW